MREDDNDHGGTRLTADAAVSVSASPELSHDVPELVITIDPNGRAESSTRWHSRLITGSWSRA
jgi:hypothetical protein